MISHAPDQRLKRGDVGAVAKAFELFTQTGIVQGQLLSPQPQRFTVSV